MGSVRRPFPQPAARGIWDVKTRIIANNGEENGDLCAWKTSGGGRVQDITLPTGTFAVQGTWSNLANKGAGGCAISHSIVT
jgi:hypothetical protein